MSNRCFCWSLPEVLPQDRPVIFECLSCRRIMAWFRDQGDWRREWFDDQEDWECYRDVMVE